MTSLKSYLLRAVRDWAVDNGLTPHLTVDATMAGVDVPRGHVENGHIVLNIHPQAVGRFELGEEVLRFAARFGPRSHAVEVPLTAVLAVYARENGQGIAFPETAAGGDASEPPASPPSGKPPTKGPALKLVK